MSSTPPDSAAEPIIEVDSLVRHFGKQTVLNGVSFKVYAGDTFVIMGGSGCGKSTLLRHLIGVVRPDRELPQPEPLHFVVTGSE